MGRANRSGFEPRNIAVTGGAGFIGSHLVDHLLRQFPDAKVTIYDAFTYAADIRNLRPALATGRAEVIRACVTDREALQKAFKGADTVLHLAAESHVPRSFEEPDLFDRVNHLGSLLVAQTAAELGVKRLLHMSTDEVYGPSEVPLTETASLRPTTPYARSKADAEDAVRAFSGSIDLRIARPVNAVGPRQHLEKLVPRFSMQAIKGEAFTIEGSGHQSRRFISVSDLCDALIHIIGEDAAQNGTFNIAGSEPITVLEIAKTVAGITGVKERLELTSDRQVNDAAYGVDGTALKALGHENRRDFTKECRRVFEDVRMRIKGGAHDYSKVRRVISPPPLAPVANDQVVESERQIRFHEPWRSHSAPQAIESVFAAGRLAGGGEFTRQAENRIRETTGAEAVWLTHSCTAAMEMAALALGLGPGDEVIVPTYTFCATATAFERSGAKTVFADIDPDTMMLDIESVKSRLTKRTKAVVAVHYGGTVLDIAALRDALKGTDIHIVEDAAQAVGSRLRDKAAGIAGIMGCYSFHDSKVLSSGQGGALLLNVKDEALIRRINGIMNRGTNFEQFRAGLVSHYEWVDHGGSYLPSEMQAALINDLWPQLPQIIEARGRIAEVYRNRLSSAGRIWRRLAANPSVAGNHHIEALILPTPDDAESLIRWLKERGAEAQSHFKPLHLSMRGKQVDDKADCPAADTIWNRIVRLPIHTSMTEADAEYVANIVENWSNMHQSKRRSKIAAI